MSAETPVTPSGGGGKLESLSKEDLIKFAKHQTLLVGKAKAKIEELSKKSGNSGEVELVLQQKVELEGQLDTTRREKAGLEQEVTSLQQEAVELRKENASVQDQLEEVRGKYEEAEEERVAAVEAYQQIQRSLEESSTDRTSQVQELETKVASLTNQLMGLKEENDCLKLQHASTLESVKTVQLEYQKLSEEHKVLVQQQESTAAELEESNKKKEKLVVNFKLLKQKYLETRQELGDSRADSPASLSSPREGEHSDSDLKSQLDALQKDYAEQKDLLAEVTSECDKHKQLLAEHKAEYDKQRQVLEQVTSDFDKEKQSLAQITAAYDEQKAMLQQVTDDYDTEKQALALLTTNYDKQKMELEQATANYDKERQALAQMSIAYDTQKETLTKMTTDYHSLEEAAAFLREDNDKQKEENEEIRMQLEKTAKQVLENEVLKSSNEELKARCETSEAEWKKKLEALKEEYEEGKQQQQRELSALTEQLEAANTLNEQSKGRVEELVLGIGKESAGVISQYEEKIAGYESERAQLLARIQELSEERSALPALSESAKPTKEDYNAEETEARNDETQKDREEDSEELKAAPEHDGGMQDYKVELEKERELSRSQQAEMTSLSTGLKGLEDENDSFRRTQEELEETVQRLVTENEKMKKAFGDHGNLSELLERMRVMEINSSIKDSNIEELKTKFSDLVNYTSKLKTKCKALLETNDQLSTTVEQQERKLANDARGARNLELHFQETENNMNEQIAHFHEERDQMIANVKEYASNIERLRMEMLPFKEQEKRCVTIFRTGLILLDDLDEDKELPMTNLVGFAKALVGKALKYKKDWQTLHNNHASVQRSDIFRKRVTLNWRLQFEKEALMVRNLKKRIASLEEKLQELGGEIGDPEEGFEVKASPGYMKDIEPMSQEDLKKEALIINEQELQRMYKYAAEIEDENTKLEFKIQAYTERLKNANLLDKSSVVSEESGEEKVDGAVAAPDTPMDVRPKVRTVDVNHTQPQFLIKAIQTDETLSELEDEAIKGLRKTISTLKDELKAYSTVSDELAALKNDRSQEGVRLEELTQQMAASRSSNREKDLEIDYLLSVIQRNKSRIEQQAKQVEELDMQLNKLGFQEKYKVQIGDTQHAKLQASLSAAYVDLQKSNDERDALQSELDEVQKNLSREQNRLHTMQEDLTTQQRCSVEDFAKISSNYEQATAEIRKLEEQNQLLVEEGKEAKTQLDSLRQLQEDTLSQKESLSARLVELSEDAAKEREEFEVVKKDLAGQISDYEKSYEDALTHQKRLEQETSAHSVQIHEMTQKNSILSDKVAEAQLEASQYQAERQSHLEAIDDLKEVVRQLKEEQHMLNDQFLINQERNRSLERQIEQLKVELSANQKLAETKVDEKTVREWSDEKDVSNEQMAQLRQQESESQKELENLRERLEQTQADLLNVRKQAELASESLEKKYDNQIQELRIERDKLTKLTKQHEKTIEDISAQVSAQRDENDELQQQVEDLMKEGDTRVSQLTEELLAARLENEHLQVLGASACSELESLKANADKEKQEHEKLTSAMKAEQQSLSSFVEEVQKTKEGLVSQLTNRDAEITQLSNQVVSLREDLERTTKELQESRNTYQKSAVTEETVANYEAKLKEVEDRAGKFKLLALKAKKELQESKAQAESLQAQQVERIKVEHKDEASSKVGEIQTLVANYQHLQEDFDRLHDDLDTEKSRVSTMKGQLEAEQASKAQLQAQVTALNEEKEKQLASNSQLQSKVKAFEIQQVEWKTTVQGLEKELDGKQVEILELNKEILRLTEQQNLSTTSSRSLEEKLRAKINELELKVHEARDELEQANKTVSKSSVMDLEIADFERTVSTLEAEVKEKVETIESLQQDLEHERQKLASLEQQLTSADEQRDSVQSRYEKLQQVLNKTKEELESARQQETETKTTDLAVRGELEMLRQQYEDSKVELAKMSSSKLAAEGKLKSSQDAQQRLMRSMENKQRALQSDLEASRKENTVLQDDYDGYKVRVHSVLKQQQTRASVEAALESEKVEKEHLQEVLSQVKVKLQEASDKLTAALSENGLLQDEIDKLSLKHNKLAQEVSNKEGVWRQRLDQLMLENSTISAEHSSSVAQMTQHTEIMTQTFKDQMQASKLEHEQQLAAFASRIERVETERNSLMLEVQSLRQQQGNSKPEQVSMHRQHSSQGSLAQPTTSDVKYKVRESGEGMEHPNPSHITSSQASQPHASSNTLVGLEQLLTSPDDDVGSVVSLGSGQAGESGEEAQLKTWLHLSQKQLEHLRELLNDSEATCLRYNEQVKLLKQEIRRLESNQQRENAISNMEYLKNIVYKFLTLESGDERGRLLPVLNTMLKFNDDELSTMRRIALSGTESEAAGEGQSQSSWSGYLHRWTGFSS